MGVKEKMYLDDQRGPRLMACDSGVDPTFYRAFMSQQRQKEREQEYRERRDEEFRGKSIEQIEEYLRSQGEIPTTSPESSQQSVFTPMKEREFCHTTSDTPLTTMEEEVGAEMVGKKKRLFSPVKEGRDPLPPEFRHIRE